MRDPLRQSVLEAIRQMPDARPNNLMRIVGRQLEDDDFDPIFEERLVELLTPGDANDQLQREFQLKLTRWNSVPALHERVVGDPTDPFSFERQEQIYRALALGVDSIARLRQVFPLIDNSSTVIARKTEWESWYSPDSMQNHYWPRYRELLERKGFDPNAIVGLDRATTEVVERLANPSDPEVWQTKGLVVGHVQSGKTANFTGVVSKAIDAGYKLVIVLTGTYDNLRSQTQKRLDMELVGRENILQGRFQAYLEAEAAEREAKKQLEAGNSTPAEYAAVLAALKEAAGNEDYASTEDVDWSKGKFLETREPLDHIGVPWIIRLTDHRGDYKALKNGLDALEFQHNLMIPTRPLYAPENLGRVPVRLAIMKKNASVLKKLATDLSKIRAKLEDVPTLIIDDEADQASINTKRDKRAPRSREERERTAINKHITEMLSTLPRAQYLAYTATPFANVFVDLDDELDVFPKDFIISLRPSPDYMGAKQLHDLEEPIDTSPEHSNRAAYHRPISLDSESSVQDGMIEALDAFVLTGATKLLRQERGFETYRHHTMLVHESQSTGVHAETQEGLESLWRKNAYGLPKAKARLRDLWDRDFAQVSAARSEESAPVPTFDELWLFVTAAVRKIEKGASPVVMVNGTKDSDYTKEDIAFEKRDVWKILVGGAKLSRGFTVEGLTISVYTRVSLAADTLMQMGRWFGYRRGYKDLVRIYLGTDIARRGVSGGVDLYDAFTAIARDEEDFRSELDQYAGLNDDGSPRVLPIDVPPLVVQRLPWLKPTSANKMYNSRITSKGIGGRTRDFPLQAGPGDGTGNRSAVLDALDLVTSLNTPDQASAGKSFLTDTGGPFDAYFGVVDAQRVLQLFKAMPWEGTGTYGPDEKFFRDLVEGGKLDDFGVVVPLLGPTPSVPRGYIEGHPDQELAFIRRGRRDRGGFSGSSKRQRPAIERIAQLPAAHEQGGPLAAQLSADRRGALLLNFSQDPPPVGTEPRSASTAPLVLAPKDVAVHLSIAFPYKAAPKGIIVREVQREDQPDRAFVEKLR